MILGVSDTSSRPDYAAMSHEARVAELSAMQARRARLDAQEIALLHAMAQDALPNADGSGALDKMWVREDVACVLRIAPVTAGVRMRAASERVTRLPATLAALAVSGPFFSKPIARSYAVASRRLSSSLRFCATAAFVGRGIG